MRLKVEASPESEITARDAFQNLGGLSQYNGLTWDDEDSIRRLRERRDYVGSLLESRLGVFRAHRLKGETTLCNHWAIVAFKDNVKAMIEVFVLFDMIPSNLNRITHG